ncbi:hypothetical protein ETQ85_17990 [Zoogloea oleivorans]|uniref:Uncharacterized protein n=1 Tax=Zoogloea oleivorans TaxID=1552750 RepID=A0A6C2CKQ9_9RHOO|nr:hypothetical protein [Zoogloea oleivorans]TYC54571.1 hypothetical protein ETQ85_17990 [Zoogloea oleivorans]
MSPPAFLRLRTPALFCALMLLSSTGLVWSSHQLLTTTGQAARSAAVRLVETENRLHQQQETDRLTRDALADYLNLQQAGLQRPVDRVTWQERLQAMRIHLQAEEFSYEIGPERPLRMAGDAEAHSPTIFTSTLQLRAKVRHEDELLTLINTLKQPGQALRPTRCTLARPDGPERAQGLAVNCDIDWISVRIPPVESRNTPG